jgi:parallel beta-helix repeat protein
MGQVVKGSRLRARLLVGVAAVAVAAPVAGKAVAQDAKWQPWLEAGGQVGTSRSFGDVDMFIPVWQDQTSLLFGDLRGKFSTDPTQEGNFGLGYRTQVDPEWILGGYGYFDIQNSQNDNLFYQATLGIEALSVDWDFRLNGYIPFNSGGQTTNNNNGDLKISGNTIGITHDEEKSLYGFDGEVGWRLPIFPADGDMDVRAFIGGYYFTNSDVDTVAGPRGRLEVRLYDLDFLGVQSRLTVDGEVQWDSPRGTQAFGGLELRIPLGVVTGDAGPKLSPLDRRMVDRVQRDVDIVTRQFQSNPDAVTVDELTVKTHTIVFASADGSPTGKGTKNDPISLDAAAARGQDLGKNAIIVVQGDAGDIGVDQPLQLSAGQALLGGGSVVPLHSTKGITENFNVPGSRPTLVGSDSGQDLIDMASGSQNEIFGLDLTGQMSNGIFGLNMERAIVKQTNIDPPIANGIYIVQATEAGPTPASSFVHLESNTVIGASENGIKVANFLFDGATHSQTVIIDHNTANGNGYNGIVALNLVGGSGTALSQNLVIAYNTANGNGSGAVRVPFQVAAAPIGLDAEGGIGIAVGNFALSGGAISQGLAILHNTTNYNFALPPRIGALPIGAFGRAFAYGGIGIAVANAAEDGVISQAAVIEGNTADANSHAGIVLGNLASEDGLVAQQASVYKNFVSGNGMNEEGTGVGIAAVNVAYEFGTVAQTLFIDGNTVLANQGDGILAANVVLYNGSVAQTGQIAGNTISNNAFSGIWLFNGADRYFPDAVGTAGESITQSMTIANNVIENNGEDGIGGFNGFTDGGGTLVQSLGIASNTIIQNDGHGIGLYTAVGSASVVSQAIFVDANTIAQNDRDGVFIGASVGGGGTLSQGITLLDNTIVSNLDDGIDIYVKGWGSQSSVSQSVSIAGNTIASNDGDGIFVGLAAYYGLHASQSVVINNNIIDDNRDDGIDLFVRAWSGGTVEQSATIANNTVTDTDANGIEVTSYISNSGTALTQALNITGNSINNSLSSNGILVGARVYSGAVLTQTVAITGNSINDVEKSGIYVSLAVSAANAVQSLTVANNTISDVRTNGITVYTVARSGLVSQPVFDISNNTITDAERGIAVYNRARRSGTIIQGSTDAPAMINNNTITDVRYGITVYNRARVGAISQVLQINNNSIADAIVGIYVSSAIFNGATANQQITIADNVLNDVSTGILVHNSVFNGADATQSITILGNQIDAQGRILGAGIAVSNDVFNGGDLTQGLAIQSNTIAHASSGAVVGIGVYNHANTFGDISQTLVIDANSVASGFSAGVGLENVASFGGDIGQNITITNNNVGSAIYAGIGIVMDARRGSDISQGGTIAGNLVAGQTGVSGGGLVAIAYGSEGIFSIAVTQDLLVSNNTFSNNNANGVYLRASAANGAVVTQNFSFSGNAIDNNGSDGVKAIAIGVPNSALQTLTFVSGSGNTINDNGNYGVFGSNVNATTQDIHLGNSSLTGNGVAATGGNANFTNP